MTASPASIAADIRDVGGRAPAIDLQRVLQAPPGTDATLQSLQGKVIVLEFWATWCPSCVKAISHFNELVDQVKDQPVQFIAVTDEDEQTVTAFLSKHPMRGWIGLNTNGSMIRSYGIHTGNPAIDAECPLTVVIRPDGTVDARLRPWAIPFPLAAQNLIDLAHDKPSGLVSSRIIFAGDVQDSTGNPLADAEVRATETMDKDTWRLVGDAVTNQKGHFKIDREYPLSYFSGPILLQVSHAGFVDSRLEDLRSVSPAQQRDLHINMRRPTDPDP
jgi:thiol-disulfide isomerase/thioredoxin